MPLEGFLDSQFEDCLYELSRKSIDGWELFTEYNGVEIYRLYDETTGLYEYKIYGALDVAPDICARVYMDLEYRKKWDSFVKDLRVIQEDGEDKQVVYWQVKFPWPLWNRDYVYRRQLKTMEAPDGTKVYIVLAREYESDQEPERSGVVRVDKYINACALTDDGKGGSRAFMHYFDNPGGNIPAWLINWGAKTGVPTFLTSMEKSCKGYEDYLAGKS